MRTIAIDFETYYDNECSVKTYGPWGYTRHPDYHPILVSVSDGNDSWAGKLSDLDWSAIDNCRWLAHNAAFDIQVYLAAVEAGQAPALTIPSWDCTSSLSAYLTGAHDLKSAAKIMLNTDLSKGARTQAKGKTLAWFTAPENYTVWRDFVKYAKDDAYYCWHIWNEGHKFVPDIEKKLMDITIESAQKGVTVDQDMLFQQIQVIDEELVRTKIKLPWVMRDNELPASPLAIARHCEKEGIPGPPVKAEDEEAHEAWVNEYSPGRPWIKAISWYRKVNKMRSFLKSVESRLRPDGTVETNLKYYGGHTGRWTGENGLNFQNLRKKDLDIILPDGTLFPVKTRELFKARPGYKFAIPDYTQIEPRVLNWLVGNEAFLDQVREGYAVYEAHARATMGWSGGVLKDEDPAQYALAKARVLMLGYQAGWKKFQATAYKYLKKEISEEESKKIVEGFRSDNPQLVAYWNMLDEGFKKAANEKHSVYSVTLPSGRQLTYRNPQIKHKHVVVPNPMGGTRGKWITYAGAQTGWEFRSFYGGKLTENVTQATARDVFVLGLINVIEAGYHVPFHVHDELIVEVPESTNVEVIRELINVKPAWLEGCPIECGIIESPCYLKED